MLMKMYSVVASSGLIVMIINGYSGHGKTFFLSPETCRKHHFRQTEFRSLFFNGLYFPAWSVSVYDYLHKYQVTVF